MYFVPKNNRQEYCSNCSYMLKFWHYVERRKLRREQKFKECKPVRNKDGSINFKKEAKEIKHLLKYYGLR